MCVGPICTPIICRNPLKPRLFNKKYTFTICVGRVWVVIVYFLLEKETFNGLLKVIGIQYILYVKSEKKSYTKIDI